MQISSVNLFVAVNSTFQKEKASCVRIEKLYVMLLFMIDIYIDCVYYIAKL